MSQSIVSNQIDLIMSGNYRFAESMINTDEQFIRYAQFRLKRCLDHKNVLINDLVALYQRQVRNISFDEVYELIMRGTSNETSDESEHG